MRNSSMKWMVASLLAVIVVAWGCYYFLRVRPDHLKVAMQAQSGAQQQQQTNEAATPQSGENSGEDSDWVAKTLEIIKNGDGATRYEAVMDLRKRGTPEAVKLLTMFLADADHAIVTEAIDALGNTAIDHGQATNALAVLEQYAADKDFSQRGQALLTATIVAKDQLLPAIAAALSDADGSERGKSLKFFSSLALTQIATTETLPYVGKLLDSSNDERVIRNCSQTLAKIHTPEAVDLLKQKTLAATGLAQFDYLSALSAAQTKESKDFLIAGIRDNLFDSKVMAQFVMQGAGAGDVFSAFLSSQDIDDQKKISLLQVVEKNADQGVASNRRGFFQAVTPLLLSNDQGVEVEAIRTLGKLGIKEAGDYLIPMLSSSDPEVRKEARLSYINFTDRKNYQTLFDFISDDDANVRKNAMMRLTALVTSNDVQFLQQAKNSDDPYVQQAATQLLQRFNN